MLYLEAKHFLADHNLNYMDKAGMAYGVEVRVPFLDHDLVAFASQLPVNMKWRGREGKYLLKKAMEPMLPREVVYRPKTGFGAPLRRWIRNELREVVEDVLSPAAIGDRGLFDASGVRALIDADRAGRVDGAYAIFALMAVELWCRMFIDQPIIPTGPR
jgi:asparagine synthase (glutamine-hydrolysing)